MLYVRLASPIALGICRCTPYTYHLNLKLCHFQCFIPLPMSTGTSLFLQHKYGCLQLPNQHFVLSAFLLTVL